MRLCVSNNASRPDAVDKDEQRPDASSIVRIGDRIAGACRTVNMPFRSSVRKNVRDDRVWKKWGQNLKLKEHSRAEKEEMLLYR